MTVADVAEHDLLARIRAVLEVRAAAPPGLIVGIGDDAAVVSSSRNTRTVLTTDAQIEGVHFKHAYAPPQDIGARAVAVNLSDLAAMGARPRWVLLSLMLPDITAVTAVERLAKGVADEAERYGVTVVGGNVSRTPGPLIVDLTAVGEVHPRRIITRAGCRPGDVLYVSGCIGAAAAGLEMLEQGMPAPASPNAATSPGSDGGGEPSDCVERYRRPTPRVRLGIALANARAVRGGMDLSDGLADAARQLAEASGCGVEIDATALPIAAGARTWWDVRGVDPVMAALSGGDDYELLVAVPRAFAGRLRHVRARVAEPTLTAVGRFVKDPTACVLIRDGRRETLPSGFAHWRGSAEPVALAR